MLSLPVTTKNPISSHDSFSCCHKYNTIKKAGKATKKSSGGKGDIYRASAFSIIASPVVFIF